MADTMRLWGRIIKNHRIAKSLTVNVEDGDVQEALRSICRQLDIPYPLFLPKHEREFENFARTAFTKDHFMEPIAFVRFEIELLQSDEKKKHLPRNPLSEA